MDLDAPLRILDPTTGRPYWRFADGSLLPVVAGGDGSTDGGAGDGGSGQGTPHSGPGTDPTPAGSGSQDGGEPGPAGGAPDANGDSKTDARTLQLTQDQLDELIERRLSKARKTWENEAKTAAERAKMDEAQRLAAEKADAERAAEEARREALTVRVETAAQRAALTAQVDPARVDRFLRLVDLDVDELTTDGQPDQKAIDKVVRATLDDWPEFKAASGPAPGRSGGEMNHPGGQRRATSLEEAVSARLGG